MHRVVDRFVVSVCVHEPLAVPAAAVRSDQWRRDGGQFIPNPATWINQQRWLDEVLPSKSFSGPLGADPARLKKKEDSLHNLRERAYEKREADKGLKVAQ